MVNFWVDIRIQPHSSRRRKAEAKAVAAAEAEDIIEQQESYLVDKLP
jgi:hypothetical protein